MVYSIMSTSSRTSTEGDLESVPSGSHGHDPSLLDSEEFPQHQRLVGKVGVIGFEW